MIQVLPTASATAQAILDLTLLGYCTFNTLRIVVFSLHCIFFYTVLFTGHLTELQSSLAQVSALQTKAKANKKKRKAAARLIAQLTFYRSEHARIHHFVQHLNRQTVSSLIFVTLSANILANVVLLNFLLIARLGSLEKAFIALMTFFQFFFVFIGTQILIYMVAPLYTVKGLLYRAQGCLKLRNTSRGRNLLLAKVRLNTFFELVCSKKKFTFTAGSLSKITKNAIFKVRIE